MAKRRKRKLDPLLIETSTIISEVRVSDPYLVRLTRLKYEAIDYWFIDIRTFSRGWGGDDGDTEVFYPTPKGVQMKEAEFLSLIGPYMDMAGKPPDPRPVH